MLSEARRQLIRRAATLAIQCEQAEAAMSKGEAFAIESYVTATNALRRVLDTLGLGAHGRARDGRRRQRSEP